MSRFYVGQRVRIKYSIGWPELAGQAGVIVAASIISNQLSESFGKRGWMVAPDVWGACEAPYESADGSGIFCPLEDQLEPATDSYDVTTWDQCVWQPEHLRAEA